MKYIIGVVGLALLAVVAYYAWDAYEKGIAPPPPPPPPPPPALSTYATTTFSLQYPSTFTLDESYAYEGVPGKPIAGVKVTVPGDMTSGTNLSSDSGVSVESLPRAAKCTGDIYVLQNVKAADMTVGSTTYSVATTSEAAAGNLYEEHVYALKGSQPCIAVRYLIHSGNIANYPAEGEGSVREFDRTSLLRAFDAIRDSVTLSQ
jgi:hypothetical protein